MTFCFPCLFLSCRILDYKLKFLNYALNNMEVKSNRERYTERLKAKYPDREFADDEALFGQINDDYDGYDKELSG